MNRAQKKTPTKTLHSESDKRASSFVVVCTCLCVCAMHNSCKDADAVERTAEWTDDQLTHKICVFKRKFTCATLIRNHVRKWKNTTANRMMMKKEKTTTPRKTIASSEYISNEMHLVAPSAAANLSIYETIMFIQCKVGCRRIVYLYGLSLSLFVSHSLAHFVWFAQQQKTERGIVFIHAIE